MVLGYRLPRMKKLMKGLVVIGSLVLVLGSLSSCIPLAAGAAGGYFMHKEGYRLQSPVKKSEKPAPRAEMVVPEG
ncbi:MAG: hypothetical protein CBC46_09245 [Verrucomicrobiaceae bacterium TMED86]|nr:MAG: hypothetical protein CBC46_09245 [Verrucomicrobiaceae bacterium TMED86]